MRRPFIIDRYLLRQFLQVFAICFCSLTGLYIVIDGFGNLEEFIAYAEKQSTNLLSVMGEYYAYRSLSFFDRTSGILTLIAARFTVTWIQRHQELTALQAAGISKSRVIKPVVLAVVAISLLSALNRELVIPAVRGNLSRNAQDLGGSSGKELQPKYDNETDILLRGQQTFGDEQRISQPNFLLPPALEPYGKQIIAESAYYSPARGNRPGGYLLTGVEQPRDLDSSPSLALGEKLVLITPFDAPWLKGDECFVVSEVSFEQLEGGQAWRQWSSTFDLVRGLRNRSLDFGADVRVAIHSRVVQPLLDVTLLFLGLPLILSRSNRNVFVAIGLCVGVVLAFMLVVMGCQYLGSAYIPGFTPALAAWLPLMIFIPCAVALSQPLYE